MVLGFDAVELEMVDDCAFPICRRAVRLTSERTASPSSRRSAPTHGVSSFTACVEHREREWMLRPVPVGVARPRRELSR